MMNIWKFIFIRLRIPSPLIPSPHLFFCYNICLNYNMKLLGHFLIQTSNVAHKPAFLEQLQNNAFQYWIILTMKSEKRAKQRVIRICTSVSQNHDIHVVAETL